MSLRLAALSTVIALVAAACAGGGGSTVAADPSAGQAQEAEATDPPDDVPTTDEGSETVASEPAERPSADPLWWSADTVDGGELVAADLAGRNVVLWLWAPWCTVCNREAPEVAQALADLPDDVTMIGVAGRDDVGPMQDFVAEHDLGGMTHVVDADGSIWSSYGISYQPAWVFIDADGNASVAAGMLGYDGLFAGIDEAFRS